MIRAGYHPGESAAIWRLAIEEREAAEDPEPFVCFATHPSSAERMRTLEAKAHAMPSTGRAETGEARYRKTTRRLRRGWLRDELRKRELAANRVVIDRLLEAEPSSGELHFFSGELLRLRNQAGDDQLALEAYRRALTGADAPVETHRALGLVLWRGGQESMAKDAFETYLAVAPDARDREIVESYIEALGD